MFYLEYDKDKPKKKKYLVEYSSNNSGGDWWLKDKDWKNLEAAGWEVLWKKDNNRGMWVDDDGRFLRALATEARKEFDSVEEAIKEWEQITGQTSTDEGCNCCGPPHAFSWNDKDGNHGYSSGADNLSHLFDEVPGSLREAAEMLEKNPPLDTILNVKNDK